MSGKLFLLDAFALIYRAHFAFSKNPRISSKGLNTGCILGFTNTILEVIQKEKPTHLGIAFDTPQPTFRHIEFEAYKAQRDAQPEDITLSLPYIRQMIQGFGIPIIEMPGYEADDVIGTIAKKAAKEGFEVYMMTSDKDYSQIVDENIYLYKPSFMGKDVEIHDVARVLEKWGIKRIDQVTDILGLMGDAVDNIPGIPGVGEKTAQKLIEEFDTVENLIKNTDSLKGKLKENVEKFGEQGILSKRLATIFTDVPVTFDPNGLNYTGPDKELLGPLFDELEFRTLKTRLFGASDTIASPKQSSSSTSKQQAASKQSGQFSLFDSAPTQAESLAIVPDEDEAAESTSTKVMNSIDTVEHLYHLITDRNDMLRLVQSLSVQDIFCFDTETTSLQSTEASLVGISFCYKKGEAYYVAIPHADRAEAMNIIELFKPVLENASIKKIGHNIKYDLLVLQNYGIQVQGELFDTMVAHYLIQPELRHNMDYLAETYLNYSPISIETLIGKKGVHQGNMADVDPVLVSDYAAEDADITFQLYQLFEPAIREGHLHKLYNDVEAPLIHVLADMERAGVRVDVAALKDISVELETLSKEEEAKVYELAGQTFNLSSPKQLGEILFDKLKLDPKAKKTKTGQYATGEEVLSKLADEFPIVNHILTFREYQKLKSTYVDALPELISPTDHRIHTSYNQTVAATGRLSSVNPNLQNIPIRTDKGKEIRKAFIKGTDQNILLSADYSQIELRIMAAFSGDETMTTAFRNGEDIHASTASKVFNIPLEDVTSDHRRKAKMVNFGIIYGISAFGLSQRLGISRTEAGEIINAYFEKFAAVKQYMDECVNKARETEYVETILGRRRYLRDINSRNMVQRGFAERNAINAPIQGSAADIIKVAMVNIHHWMKDQKLQSKMILQVHDELVFDIVPDELEIIRNTVPEYMKTAIPLSVPMEVGLGIGDNWLQAH